ncbi:MAG: hypothetical protein PSX36_01020 [bacterium]|nr:hypothetical protein [bacterium]
MKKFASILFLSQLLNLNVNAQDQLFKKDNTKVLVKITEVGLDEVKYKLFSNLTGPTYIDNKRDIALIIYENGIHEVMTNTVPGKPAEAQAGKVTTDEYPQNNARPMNSKKDSASYFKYSNSISINFFNFVNNELGIIYQKEYFKNNFNIQIPFAVGADKPYVTQSTYFNSNNYGSYTLNRKIFEVGFGINYYPSLRNSANYYIGPSFRYMQYDGTQTYGGYQLYTNNSVLTRYCMSITNGLVLRTQSRIVIAVFGSLGFKHDAVSSMLEDPITKQPINPVSTSFNLYFWTGFNVGFCF